MEQRHLITNRYESLDCHEYKHVCEIVTGNRKEIKTMKLIRIEAIDKNNWEKALSISLLESQEKLVPSIIEH